MAKKKDFGFNFLSLKDISPDLLPERIESDSIESYSISHAYTDELSAPDGEPILLLQGKAVGSPGNIVTITGLAKSRKSVLVSAIISASFSELKKFLGFEITLEDPEVLHIDSEQGLNHYVKSVRRSIRDAELSSKPKKFNSFHTRDATAEFRVEFTGAMIEKYKPDICIIDGITDYVYDLNSQEEATRIGERLLQWSFRYNCLIVAVIHVTKGKGFMTGALGTYLEKKCETSIKVEKPDDQKEISNIVCQYARNLDFAPFTIRFSEELRRYYVVDESEITSKSNATDPKLTSLEDHKKTLYTLFNFGDLKSYKSEEDIITALITKTKYNLNKKNAKIWFAYYNKNGWIMFNPTVDLWQLTPQRTITKLEPLDKKPDDNPDVFGDTKGDEFADDLPF